MYQEKYNEWINSTIIDEDIKNELRNITDEKEIEDRFYKELEFGTGGLRGIIAAGSNRMNIYTVSKATQGFADYLNDTFKEPTIAIAYDSRNKSAEFAKSAALTLCGNGIKVFLYSYLMPTPVLSFAVRHLKCSGGIVITASHNPKEYNGYKVYDEFGGQVTDNKANKIIKYVNNITDFGMIKNMSEDEAIKNGLLIYIGEEVDTEYINNVKSLAIRRELVKAKARDLKIIYTPIHGSGNIPVRRILGELGYSNLKVVKEQEEPDGNFPTAPYPNPEKEQVFELALNMAKKELPDIILGTDPDCDRIGVVVNTGENNFRVLTGNETGLLLANYILSSLDELNKLPSNGALIKTIVTTESIRNIAEEYNVELIDVLTGFKYIGEKIQEFKNNNDKKFLFGLEESYGYLAGEFVRDKDAVIASMLIAEMALYYKDKGISLYDALIDIYEKYGYYKETLVSIDLHGIEGQRSITKCIEGLRSSSIDNIAGVKIVTKYDYKLSVKETNGIKSEIKLPKSNVLRYILSDSSSVIIRPSGTEPKMKVYLAVKGNSLTEVDTKIIEFKKEVFKIINL
ncbi:Phosphoglucomutase [Clostridium paraputrificum]|uniref:Phosphoglucomutase n=1 Tax=Clostridium paraputrificum TaxID=29363 RepID=A0A6N3C399_9CLOT